MTKQVIIFHLVTKCFADGAVVTCGETEQSVLSHCGQHEPITTGWLGTSLYQNTPPAPAPPLTPFKLCAYAAGLPIEPMHWGGEERFLG